jgi:hypothetical protein
MVDDYHEDNPGSKFKERGFNRDIEKMEETD